MRNYHHHRPQEWFREHLLDVFEALGPSVDTVAVRQWLIQRLSPWLSSRDFEMVNNGKSERWWHLVHWNRQHFSKEGLVYPGSRAPTATGTYVSPHGRWELTEKGKQLIEARKSSRASAQPAKGGFARWNSGRLHRLIAHHTNPATEKNLVTVTFLTRYEWLGN